jgi:peptidyl-dipeptidase A
MDCNVEGMNMGIRDLRRTGAASIALLILAACGGGTASAPKETAEAFLARYEKDMQALTIEGEQAGWVQLTYINGDTEALSAKASERQLTYFNKAVKQAKTYDLASLSPESARKIKLIKQGVTGPAPDDPARLAELTQLSARLESLYGAAKFCPDGEKSCKGIDELGDDLIHVRDYDAALKIWTGWHNQGAQIKDSYVRFVELSNEGARDLGFKDMGALWRSGYDMPADEFTATTAKLWEQVKPLYDALHCYTRATLAKKYGADKVKPGEPIPAHLLGNMWAQDWTHLYNDLLMPFPKARQESADPALVAQHWDAVRMAKSAESAYTSLGFPPLPSTFWQRSMLTRPRDREVVCHASAWDIDMQEDVRIKMCTHPTEEDLITLYHEMGHVYYYLSYRQQPYTFRDGANDGFHEAIGDAINLSMTPSYLASIGLASQRQASRETVINQQMKIALDKIAFLPFGKVVDEWRWRVFSGEIKPADYNRSWWELRRKYQGVAPVVARGEDQFDAGAKYHVPGNTPYTRYFLSYILQFQFHKALCDAAGFKGPLHECSVFGNKAAGKRFQEMLAEGQSKPWQDTLQKLTGKREIDASVIIEYFQPLMEWLARQNQGQTCGWN